MKRKGILIRTIAISFCERSLTHETLHCIIPLIQNSRKSKTIVKKGHQLLQEMGVGHWLMQKLMQKLRGDGNFPHLWFWWYLTDDIYVTNHLNIYIKSVNISMYVKPQEWWFKTKAHYQHCHNEPPEGFSLARTNESIQNTFQNYCLRTGDQSTSPAAFSPCVVCYLILSIIAT